MIIFDIDGTLTDTTHRTHYLQQTPKNWDAFYEACDLDPPIGNIVELCSDLQMLNSIIFLTGRRESTRQKTITWLKRYDLWSGELLLMRKDGDYRHDTIVKPELLKEAGIDLSNIDLVFEDRNSMVAKWRELGLTCCQTQMGDF